MYMRDKLLTYEKLEGYQPINLFLERVIDMTERNQK